MFVEYPHPFVVALAALVGACIGSFLNVCIVRWPAGESVVSPRSKCPVCSYQISAFANLPVVSWLFLRGRCANCKARISVQYPIVELIVALIWGGAAAVFGGVSLVALNVAVFFTLMLGIGITDAKYYLIPDGFTVFGLIWLLMIAMITSVVGVEDSTPFAPMLPAIIGACTGAGAIAIAGWLGEVVLKREAMGFGDVTLMAVAGAALGPERVLLTVFLGAAIGVIVFTLFVIPISKVRKSGDSAGIEMSPAKHMASNHAGDATYNSGIPLVPFGVFLAPASVVSLVYGDALITWYISLVFNS